MCGWEMRCKGGVIILYRFEKKEHVNSRSFFCRYYTILNKYQIIVTG